MTDSGTSDEEFNEDLDGSMGMDYAPFQLRPSLILFQLCLIAASSTSSGSAYFIVTMSSLVWFVILFYFILRRSEIMRASVCANTLQLQFLHAPYPF